MRRNRKSDNNHDNPKLTLLRKIQLEKEIDALIAKLSDDDVIELEKIGELTPEEIEYIKKRKRKKKSKKRIFEESLKVDDATIQRIIQVSKNFAETQRLIEENKIIQKEKIKPEDRARFSGGTKTKNERSLGGR